MSDDSLIEALPDLVAFVRRDGVVLRQLGGRRVTVPGGGKLVGRNLAELWPEEVAAQLRQMIRRALTDRSSSEGRFTCDGRAYDVRIGAHGRERALCMIREASGAPESVPGDGVRGGGRAAIERRAFVGRLKQSIADAALRERKMAVCMIHVDGLEDVGRLIDFAIAERVIAELLARLPVPDEGPVSWYVGQLGECSLAAVVEGFGDREDVRDVAARLRDSIAAPVQVGDSTFTVKPSAGLAVLGEDASRAGALLEHAHSAMLESRRGDGRSVQFYSDTLRLRSLSRLDIEQELRAAIAENQLALRYAARYELGSDTLVAVHTYLRWPHPLRGEVRAAEFLPIADSTGLAGPLSRWALGQLRRDLPRLRERLAPGVRISFGALRQHLASDALADDVAAWFASDEIAPPELELRISEQALAGLPAPGATLRRLADMGIAITVDEFGRGYTSLPRLARLPLRALQVDRSLALSAVGDPVAARAARAALAIAKALELVPIASGVDAETDRQRLHELGWAEGLGDRFGELELGVGGLAENPNRAADAG